MIRIVILVIAYKDGGKRICFCGKFFSHYKGYGNLVSRGQTLVRAGALSLAV